MFSPQNGYNDYNGYNGYGGGQNGVPAHALITNRDGIVGTELEAPVSMNPGVPNDPRNLARLSAGVRAYIFDFALMSSIEMTFEAGTNPTAKLWRRTANPSNQPGANYQQLVSLTAPSTEQLKDQLNFLYGYANIRQDRAAEIASQVQVPLLFYASISFLDPARTPRTMEFLDAAIRFTVYAEMQLKYALAVKRPIEMSPQVQPIIETPTHGSLPSGHSTESFVTARLILELMRQSNAPQYKNVGTAGDHWGEMLMRQAARIATNRTVAGVHYPVDSVAGAVLGLTLADLITSLSSSEKKWTSATFDGSSFDAKEDFDWHKVYNACDNEQAAESKHGDVVWATATTEKTKGKPDPALSWLWKRAVKEWNDLSVNDPLDADV